MPTSNNSDQQIKEVYEQNLENVGTNKIKFNLIIIPH